LRNPDKREVSIVTNPVPDDDRDFAVTTPSPVDHNTRNGMHPLAQLTILAVVVAALVAGLLAWSPWKDGNKSNTVSSPLPAATSPADIALLPDDSTAAPADDATPSPSETDSTTCQGKPKNYFTVKVENVNITKDDGAKFSGIACLAPGWTIWMYDRDPDDKLYYLVNETNTNVAAITTKGAWKYHETDIGNEGSSGDPQYVTFVLAPLSCNDYLERRDTNGDDDIVLTKGELTDRRYDCKILTEVKVLVTDE
jgi:hypothetical protein